MFPTSAAGALTGGMGTHSHSAGEGSGGTISCSTQRRQELWRDARLGCLLEGVRELEQCWLAVRPAKKGNAQWQAHHVAGGNGDVGITRDGGEGRASANVAIAVDQIR